MNKCLLSRVCNEGLLFPWRRCSFSRERWRASPWGKRRSSSSKQGMIVSSMYLIVAPACSFSHSTAFRKKFVSMSNTRMVWRRVTYCGIRVPYNTFLGSFWLYGEGFTAAPAPICNLAEKVWSLHVHLFFTS